MSDRWKYQITQGLFWAIFTTFFITLIDIYETSFKEVILTKIFYIRIIFFLFFGIFGIGYYSWKMKVKNENNKQ